jgi:glycosyltransferase involved in cell wall biosynthesis
MSNFPLVSIICTTYNHENYIAQTLEGFLMQEVSFPIEIIVHDDASTDNTVKIVKKYEKNYSNLFSNIYQTINQYSRNKGIVAKTVFSACRGKYIAICEGDDFWNDPHKLQKQISFLEENEDYGFIHSDCDFYFQEDKKLIKNYNKRTKAIIPNGYVFDKLVVNNFIKTLTVCFRRKLIENSDFWDLIQNNNWPMGDYPMWLEFSYHTKFYYIPASLATRRVLTESASISRNHEGKLKFLLSACDISSYFYKKYGCDKTMNSAIILKKNRLLLQQAFFLNDKKSAKKIFSELKDMSNLKGIGIKLFLLYMISQNGMLSNIVRRLLRNKYLLV